MGSQTTPQSEHIALLPKLENLRLISYDSPNSIVLDSPKTHPTHGTTRSSTFSLIASAVGAGVMIASFSLKSAGIVNGLLLLNFFGYLAYLSFNMLVESSRLANLPRHLVSFEGVAEHYYGKRMKQFVQFNLLCLLVGAMITLMVLAVDNLMPIVYLYYGSTSAALENGPRTLLLVLSGIFIFPFCLAKKLHALRYTSMLVLLCIAYIFVLVVFTAFKHLVQGRVDFTNLHYFDASPSLLYAFSIQSLAFCCQFNVLPIFVELQNPTEERVQQVHKCTILLCIVLYSVFAFLGYVAFGAHTTGDILKSFDPSNLFAIAGRIVFGVCLLFKVPLIMHPLRSSLGHLLYPMDVSLTSIPHKHRHDETWFVILSTVCVLIPVTIVSILVPQIERLYSILGATAGGSVCFLLPAVIYYKAPVSSKKKQSAQLMFAVGIISIVSSLYISVFPPVDPTSA